MRGVWGPRRDGGLAHLSWAWVGLVAWSSSPGTAAQVTIEGGREPGSPYQYAWTLTNDATQRVVTLEFPHYLGVLFTPPPGWTYEMTEQVTEGKRVSTGVVRTWAESPQYAILPRQSAVCRLSVAVTTMTTPGRGTVKVGFADGTFETVPGVEIPWQIPWLQRRLLLIGFGTMFVVYLIVRAVRSRNPKAVSAEPPRPGE